MQVKNEHYRYSGFYHVPTLPNTLINEKGQVIDLIKNWCPLIDINKDGYHCVNSDNDRRFIHRLLALTFLEEPELPVTELDVNHIDGIKDNNSISNLEWATRSRNCFHAYETGLRTDNVSVLVKDLRDGSIVRYYSIHECARKFNTDPSLIFNELRDYNYGKVYKKYYVLIHEGKEWPNTGPEAIGKYRNGTAKTIIVTRLEDGSKVIFKSVGEAAKELGFKNKTLVMHILRYGTKPYHGWSFQYLEDFFEQGGNKNQFELKSYLSEMVS